MAELIVSLAIIALCSLLIVQWYMQMILHEKHLNTQIAGMVEIMSSINTIKVQRVLTGSKNIPYGTLDWHANSFGAGLPGHWVTLRLHSPYTREYIVIFGVP